MIAVYLGSFTLVIGRNGVTVHPHTRGTLDPTEPMFGFRRQKGRS